jgi:hypothetical protein
MRLIRLGHWEFCRNNDIHSIAQAAVSSVNASFRPSVFSDDGPNSFQFGSKTSGRLTRPLLEFGPHDYAAAADVGDLQPGDFRDGRPAAWALDVPRGRIVMSQVCGDAEG